MTESGLARRHRARPRWHGLVWVLVPSLLVMPTLVTGLRPAGAAPCPDAPGCATAGSASPRPTRCADEGVCAAASAPPPVRHPAQPVACGNGRACGFVDNSAMSDSDVTVGSDSWWGYPPSAVATVPRSGSSPAGTDWQVYWVPAGMCGQALSAGRATITDRRESPAGAWAPLAGPVTTIILGQWCS